MPVVTTADMACMTDTHTGHHGLPASHIRTSSPRCGTLAVGYAGIRLVRWPQVRGITLWNGRVVARAQHETEGYENLVPLSARSVARDQPAACCSTIGRLENFNSQRCDSNARRRCRSWRRRNTDNVVAYLVHYHRPIEWVTNLRQTLVRVIDIVVDLSCCCLAVLRIAEW